MCLIHFCCEPDMFVTHIRSHNSFLWSVPFFIIFWSERVISTNRMHPTQWSGWIVAPSCKKRTIFVAILLSKYSQLIWTLQLCFVGARGLEPLKPKQMIYSHPELPLSDAPSTSMNKIRLRFYPSRWEALIAFKFRVLCQHLGAEDETRTRNNQFGRLELYHWATSA